MPPIIQDYIDLGLRLNNDDWDFIKTLIGKDSNLRFFLSQALKEQEERDKDHDLQHYQFVTNN